MGEALLRQPGIVQVHLTGSFRTAEKIRTLLPKGVLFTSELGEFRGHQESSGDTILNSVNLPPSML